jgi:hypothetical protein
MERSVGMFFDTLSYVSDSDNYRENDTRDELEFVDSLEI